MQQMLLAVELGIAAFLHTLYLPIILRTTIDSVSDCHPEKCHVSFVPNK